jgi:hypothetical protein
MTTRSWSRKLFARTPRRAPEGSPKAPARSRPRLEALEDRLAPAVQLLYNGPGSALQLTELNGAAGTTHVTIYEDNNNLNITLNGDTFAASSSAANGFTYSGGVATFNASSANAISTLSAALGADALSFGAVNHIANVVDNLDVSARTIDLGAQFPSLSNVISTTGAPAGQGNISLTATQNIVLAANAGSAIKTKDGSITLQANQGAAPTGGNFVGIDVNGATVQSSGAGAILIKGRGGNDATTAGHDGVFVHGGSTISSSGTGSLTIDGAGGAGTDDNYGVIVADASSLVTSVSGAIQITGQGSTTATGIRNEGVLAVNGGQVTSTETATITVNGTGGSGTSANHGVDVEGAGALVTSVTGNIQITGQGGTAATGSGNYGVIVLSRGQVTSTGTATITLNGTGGSGTSDNFGVDVEGAGSLVTASAGNVVVTGQGGNGTGNVGVRVSAGGSITSNSASTVSLTGTGGTVPGNEAISLTGASVSSAGAPITLTGDSMTFDGSSSINAGTGSVTLRPLTSGTAIDLGGADAAGLLGLSSTELGIITAGTLTIGSNSAGDINVSAGISLPNVSTLVLLTPGDVSEAAAGALSVNSLLVSAGGAVDLSQGNSVSTLAASAAGSFSFLDTGALAVGTVATVAGIDVTGAVALRAVGLLSIGANITSTGSVDLRAAGVTEGAGAHVQADTLRLRGTGTFTLSGANQVGTLAGAVTGAVTFVNANALTVGVGLSTVGLSSGGNDITLRTTSGGDLVLAQLVDAGTGKVTLDARAIAGAGGLSVAAGELEVVNADALGTALIPLATAISSLAARVGPGGTFLANQGALTIATIDAVAGLSSDGAVDVSSSGPLTVASNVHANDGHVSLTATSTESVADGPGPENDITVDGGVTVDASGNVGFSSTDGILIQSGALVEAKLTVSMTAGVGDNDNDATLELNGTINSGNSGVTLSSPGDICVGAINTQPGQTVSITSTGGAILDCNDSPDSTDITAGTVILSAATGIGVPSVADGIPANDAALELQVGTLQASNNTSGDISLIDSRSALTISGISEMGGGNVSVSNNVGISVTGTVSAASGGAVNLTAGGGGIAESGAGQVSTTGTLTTSSAGGTTLGGANTVGSFNATHNGGDLSLTNTASTLTIAGISEANSVSVTNTGALDLTGTVSAFRGVNLTASSTLAESGTGLVSTPGTLTTSSAGGATLGGANTVGSFNATNTSSGNIALSNTAATLSITGISETGGNVSVSNTGNLTTTGTSTATPTINAPGNTVTLNASGAIGTSNAAGITDVAAANLAVTGATGVGTSARPLRTAVGTLAAANVGTRGVFVSNNASTLTINGVAATGGAITIATSGNLTIAQPVGTATAGATAGAATLSGSGIINVNDAITGNTASVLGSIAGDAITITTTGATPLMVNGMSGGDNILVDFGALNGAVNVTETGTNRLTVQGPTAADTYTVTSTQVTDNNNQKVTYSGVQSLLVRGGNSGNTFNVQSTAAGTPVTLQTGAGDDNIVVSSAAGTLDTLKSPLTIDGQGGSNSLALSESNATAADTVSITPTAVSGAAGFVANYSNIASLAFLGGPLADTFNVTPSTSTTFSVDGNLPGPPTLPGDTLNVSVPPGSSPVLTSAATPTGLTGNYAFGAGGFRPVNFTRIETLNPAVDLSITTDDNDTTEGEVPGTAVTYTIVAANHGALDVTGATVTDTFPMAAPPSAAPGFTAVSWTSTSAGGATGNTATGTGNINDTVSLPVGSSITYVVTAFIDPSAQGTLSNTATVTPPSSVTDSSPADNTATDADTLSGQADLALTATATPSPVVAGTDLTYSMTVTNNGPSDAQGTVLTDTLPAGTVFQSVAVSQGTASTAGGTVTANLGTVPAGGTATVTVVVRIPPGTPDRLPLTNAASVASSTPDPNPANNSAAVTDTVVAPTTVCVFDPSSATWYLKNTNQPGAPDVPPFRYGAPNWTPLTGDWDGQGTRTAGAFDPTTATWYLRDSNSPGAPSITPFQYGLPGWIPVVGDWDGNGTTTIGVVDPATMTWYLKYRNGPGAWDVSFRYGQAGDIPVVGDWNGDGVTTIGVWRPGTATWYLRNSNSAGAPDISPFAYGQAGDVPVTGDWNADKVTTVGVFRPGTASWYLRNRNTPGAPDVGPFAYGGTNWLPVTSAYGRAGLMRPGDTAQTADPQPPLTQAALDGIVGAALTRLQAAGVGGALLSRLAAAQFRVSDLPLTELGVALPSADRVLIDRNAAGHGWFVDPTPLQDEEYAPAPWGALAAPAGTLAGDHMDLLTVVLHELGQLAGLTDVSAKSSPAELMGDQLGTGSRLTAALDQVFAQSPP